MALFECLSAGFLVQFLAGLFLLLSHPASINFQLFNLLFLTLGINCHHSLILLKSDPSIGKVFKAIP